MKLRGWLKAVCALLLLGTFCFSTTACSAISRIRAAGAEIGRARAAVTLPVYPAHCREAVPHAPVAAGADAISVLRLERAQLDFSNDRASSCGDFYDGLKRDLASN